MMHATRTIMATVLALALLGACATTPPGPGSDGKLNGLLEFRGTVQNINNGCFVDGICSVDVDGRTVITMRGWSRSTWGQRDPDIKVGDSVEVRCMREESHCTLEGSADYYLRPAP